MRTCLALPKCHEIPFPDARTSEDTRCPEELVRLFLEEYTQIGDVVLDPFAGYGTTLRVAEAMGRIPYGVEANRERAEKARCIINHKYNLIMGDSRDIRTLGLPPIDFCIGSPPGMKQTQLTNALREHLRAKGGYLQYLADIKSIYQQVSELLQPHGMAVIEVGNMKLAHGVTPLAWDIALVVSEVMDFQGEIVVDWEPSYGNGYDHSYCLMFSKRA